MLFLENTYYEVGISTDNTLDYTSMMQFMIRNC